MAGTRRPLMTRHAVPQRKREERSSRREGLAEGLREGVAELRAALTPKGK